MKMRTINTKKKNVFLVVSFIITTLLGYNSKIQAQVSIGCAKEPNLGVLLDLKEDQKNDGAANSVRGLIVPRLQLTQKSNLFPMFETVPGNSIPNGHYTPALKNNEDKKHIGMIVYNTSTSFLEGAGLYVWMGKNWVKMGS